MLVGLILSSKMALVDFTNVSQYEQNDHTGSIKYIESLDGGKFNDTYQTLFGSVRENNYIIQVYSINESRNAVSIELSDAARIAHHMNLESGPETTQGVSVPSSEWYDSDQLPIRKLRSYRQEDSKCKFCGEHGKRTKNLYCEVPDRNEYSNGWTHPVLAPGKTGNRGIHEDCLAFVTGFIKQFKNTHSELFVSQSL